MEDVVVTVQSIATTCQWHSRLLQISRISSQRLCALFRPKDPSGGAYQPDCRKCNINQKDMDRSPMTQKNIGRRFHRRRTQLKFDSERARKRLQFKSNFHQIKRSNNFLTAICGWTLDCIQSREDVKHNLFRSQYLLMCESWKRGKNLKGILNGGSFRRLAFQLT